MRSQAVLVRITLALHTGTGAEVTLEAVVPGPRRRKCSLPSLTNPYKCAMGTGAAQGEVHCLNWLWVTPWKCKNTTFHAGVLHLQGLIDVLSSCFKVKRGSILMILYFFFFPPVFSLIYDWLKWFLRAGLGDQPKRIRHIFRFALQHFFAL